MTDYEKLKALINEIDTLIINEVTSETPAFVAWRSKTERFLLNKFGRNSYEHNTFINFDFTVYADPWDAPDDAFINACRIDLMSAKAIFEDYLDEMNDNSVVVDNKVINENYDYSKVFIVHGHDEALKQAVARLIEKQNIKAVILHEQANQGATIIEKIEVHSDVNAAICLFTADDIGNQKNNDNMSNRARQNVVFETGYFMGKLGRDHTIILTDRDVELPSDMQGVVYTDTANWQFSVLKELKAIGYKIDYNKLD